MDEKVENIIRNLLKWKGFFGWYIELSPSEQEEFRKDILKGLNE